MPYKDIPKRRKASAEATRRWKEQQPERARLHYVWVNIRQRCSNPNNKRYSDYGGRGITVCERWNDFQAFLDDMGPRPSPNHTVERIDNSKGYSPDNCRWATRQEQSENKRNCIYVSIGQDRLTLKEACRRLSLPYKTIHRRIAVFAWEPERALNTPVVPGGWTEGVRRPA